MARGKEAGLPPFEYWFTSTTLTLWIAVVAAIGSLWVAINGDWQSAVREQARVTTEQAVQKQRADTLGAVLAVSAEADQLAYTVLDETQYEEWERRADQMWIAAQERLRALLTPAEFANVFAPSTPSPLFLGSAVNEAHNLRMRALTELAVRLRNVALKYA